MTDSRTRLDQVLDGIVTAGVWILAFLLPSQIYPPKGDVIWGSPVLGIPLAVAFLGYIIWNVRKATIGENLDKGDLVAKALVPIAIFAFISWLALS